MNNRLMVHTMRNGLGYFVMPESVWRIFSKKAAGNTHKSLGMMGTYGTPQ